MSSNEFVTQKDLDNLEEKIDLKMENIQTKMDAEFKLTNSKIDNLPTIIENMILRKSADEKKEREQERKNDRKWIIGITITIGLFAIKELLFPLIQLLLVK